MVQIDISLKEAINAIEANDFAPERVKKMLESFSKEEFVAYFVEQNQEDMNSEDSSDGSDEWD